MRQQEEKYVITFHTTAEAMAAEKACRQESLPGRLIPVPRVISAGCGLAWCTDISGEEATVRALQAHQVDCEGQYRLML